MRLRLLVAADLDEFVAYRRDVAVAAFQSWTPEFDLADARSLLAAQPAHGILPTEGEWAQLAIDAVQADGEMALVGDVGLCALAGQPDSYEICVTIAAAHQGRGYAREALEVLTDWLVDRAGAHRIIAQLDARNDGMRGLVSALGWRFEGAAVEGDWFKGEWTTLERYAVLSREWRARSRS